jgi:hypothetical protein
VLQTLQKQTEIEDKVPITLVGGTAPEVFEGFINEEVGDQMFVSLVLEKNKADKVVEVERLCLYHLEVGLPKKRIHIMSLPGKSVRLDLRPPQQNSVLDGGLVLDIDGVLLQQLRHHLQDKSFDGLVKSIVILQKWQGIQILDGYLITNQPITG